MSLSFKFLISLNVKKIFCVLYGERKMVLSCGKRRLLPYTGPEQCRFLVRRWGLRSSCPPIQEVYTVQIFLKFSSLSLNSIFVVSYMELPTQVINSAVIQKLTFRLLTPLGFIYFFSIYQIAFPLYQRYIYLEDTVNFTH